jgi:DNA polymerase III epsilon subunit-like protein
LIPNSEAWRKLYELVVDSSKIIVAHNAKFDLGMLMKEENHPIKQ